MVERATVAQVSQIGVEVTEGTAVVCPTLLTSIGFQFKPKTEVDTFGAEGTKYDTVASLGKESTDISAEGRVTYEEIGYLLNSCIGNRSTTAVGGTEYLHVFTLNYSASDTIKSLTIQKGDPLTRAMQVAGVRFSKMGFKVSRGGIELSGEGYGTAMSDGIQLSTNATYTLTAGASPPTGGTYTLTYSGQTTSAIAFGATPATVTTALEALSTVGTGNAVVSLTTLGPTTATANTVYTVEFRGTLARAPRTLTGTFTTLTASGTIAIAAGTVGVAPVALALTPVLPTQMSAFLDTTWAALGGTRLTRFLSGEWMISDRFTPVWVVDANQSSYVASVEKKPKGEITATLEADTQGMGPLTPLRAGTSAFLRLSATGGLISGGAGGAYQFICDTAMKWTELADLKDEDGVYGSTFKAVPTYDSTSGFVCKFQVRNTVSSY